MFKRTEMCFKSLAKRTQTVTVETPGEAVTGLLRYHWTQGSL